MTKLMLQRFHELYSVRRLPMDMISKQLGIHGAVAGLLKYELGITRANLPALTLKKNRALPPDQFAAIRSSRPKHALPLWKPKRIWIRRPSEPVVGPQVYDDVFYLLPRGLSQDLRDDVAQELRLAILTGEIGADDIRRHVSEFIRKVQRESLSGYRFTSLDSAASPDDDRTLLDKLSKQDDGIYRVGY